MQCWICSREARGFGLVDLRFKPADPRRYPTDWVFCSRRCQDVFHAHYGAWRAILDQGFPPEAAMMDVTPLERTAMHACLPHFGRTAEAIGFDKALGAYSKDEALAVIRGIVLAYTEYMAAEHARQLLPPVRMPSATPVRDPMQKLSLIERSAT